MFLQEERYGPRLTTSLCYVSSEDESHPALALKSQTKYSSGWQSAKHCAFPQELGFHFEGEVELEHIRFLAHESKYASCIDVYVAEATDEEIQSGVCGSYKTANFSRLGHVRFSPNEKYQFMARELKTIRIHRRCVYVKLLFRRPFKNDYNLFKQVGVVALSAHGSVVHFLNSWKDCPHSIMVGEVRDVPLDAMVPMPQESRQAEAEGQGEPNSSADTARRIAELQALKAHAVAEEDYDLAEALKKQISAAENAAKQIATLEKEKAEAVAVEDYLKAKALKQKIEALRRTAYEVPSASDSRSIHERKAGAALPPSPLVEEKVSAVTPTDPAAPAAHASSSPREGTQLHDDRVISGRGYYNISDLSGGVEPRSHRQGEGNEEFLSVAGGGSSWERVLNEVIASLSIDKSGPTPLTGEALSESEPLEREFGVYCAACLYGRRGQQREAAVRGLIAADGYRAVASHSSSVVETLLTYLTSKGKGVNDPVAGVVFATCDALQMIVAESLPGAPAVAQLHSALSTVATALVTRLSNSNSRIHESVEAMIMALAHSPFGPQKIISLLMLDPDKQAKKQVSSKAYLSRLNLLSNFVDLFGIRREVNEHALDVHVLMTTVVIPSASHTGGDVREAALKLFAKLSLLSPPVCETYMEKLKPSQQASVVRQIQMLDETDASSPPAEALVAESEEATEVNSDSTPRPLSLPRRRTDHPAQAAASKAALTTESPVSTPNVSSSLKLTARSLVSATSDSQTLKTCQFCNEYNPNFTEANLDIHYVRACPMLCPCPLCDQVTEICTLQHHLVSECEGRHLVRECPNCREAVRAEDIKRHIAAHDCIKAVPSHSICPLCHARFRSGMDNWRRHLAMAPGCPNNPRRYDGSGPIVN